MKAVIANGAGGPEVLTFVERERPEPGPGEILVRIRAAGINRPDVAQRNGGYPPPPGASDILGLEFAGTVEARGEGAERFAVGARVMGLVASGGYAEYVVVHESNALPVPDALSDVEAGAVPETFFTVWTNVFERARLRAGETILIHGGSSGIGTTAIQLAKAFGARVIATAGSAAKLDACRALGAEILINYRDEDFVEVAKAATDGRGPEVILDMVGGDYVQKNLRLAAVDGRISQIAFLNGPKVSLDLTPLLVKRLTLTGSTLRARSVAMKAEIADALAEHVLPLLADGRVRPVIDTVVPFAEVANAHRRMDEGSHVGKIVLTMD